MKRLMDDKFLSREDAERDGDDGDDSAGPGEFQRATAEEMSSRKTFTLKKRASGPPSAPSTTPANPFAGFSAAPNPFSTLSSTSNPQTTTGTFSLPPATSSTFTMNPPPASGSLALPSFPTTSLPAFSSAAPSVNRQPAAVQPPASTTVTPATSLAPPAANSEYLRKRRKLNEAFLRWAQRQLAENGVAIWKDGVRDYLRHQQTLRAQHPSEGNGSSTSSGSNGSSTGAIKPLVPPAVAAPAPVTSAPLPFTFPPAPPAASSSALPSFSLPGAAPLPASTWTFPSAGSAPAFPALSGASSSTFGFPSAPGGSNFFATPLAAPASTSAPAGDDGDGGDGDEAEPLLEPEKVLRNAADTDEILLDVNVKLFNYNVEEKEWRDMGKGPFRVTRDPASGKRRMVMRGGTGKILLNASFFKNFKVEVVKGGLKFSAFVTREVKGQAAGVDFKPFLCKLNDTNAQRLRQVLEESAAEIK